MVRKKYESVPGVRAVLDWGTVPHPGIADLDFYVIVDPGTRVSFPHFQTYTEDQRYIMNHRHHVISARVFSSINHYDPWFLHMETLFDPANAFRFTKVHFAGSAYEALSLNFIYQKIAYGCLPFVARTYALHEFNVRQFFEEVKQFKYFLREFKKMGVEYGEEDPALPLYEEALNNWEAVCTHPDRLMQLHVHFENSIAWTYRALARIAQKKFLSKATPTMLRPHTSSEKRLLKRYPRSLIVDTGDATFVYQKGCTALRIERESFFVPLPLMSKVARNIFILPWELACFPAHHLFLDGVLSRHYQRISCTDLPDVPLWKDDALRTLYTLFNQNLKETSLVTNAKYQEITYGFRFPIPQGTSLFKRMALITGRVLSGAALRLVRSSLGRLFRRGGRKILWEKSLA